MHSTIECPDFPSDLYCYLDDVSVVEVTNADAGNDTSVCSGETIPIGGLPTFDAEYTWYEAADSSNSSSIDSVHIAKPHISPTQTTSYVMWKRQCNVVTTDTVTVTVNCVGMKETKQKSGLLVYPNPATDEVRISYTGTGEEILIRDLLGKEVQRTQLKAGVATIKTTDLTAGFYFFSVLSGERVIISEKVLIRH